MKTSILFLSLVICFSNSVFSQTDKTIAAFTKSIEQEKNLNYAGAIESIMALNDSTSYVVNIRLGWLCYKAGYKKKSLDYYNKTISMMPNAVEPRYGYSFPAYLLEDYKSIIDQDKKILEFDPNNRAINGNLGSLYYYGKDYNNALTHLQKVINLYPFDYDNNLLLGWTNLKLGKNAEAEQCFNTVLLYSPKDASALEGLTYIKRNAPLSETVINAFTKSYELAAKSDYKGSIAIMREVYDKTSYVINLRLGWLCYLAGLQTESVGYYKIATELKPNAIEPKFGYAFPSEMLGNKNDLKTQYESILAIDHQNTSAHYKLGVLKYSNKDYSSALSHFEKIVQLYPSDTDGLLMLAWTHTQMGKTDEAKLLFNKVLCLYPNNQSAIQGLAYKPVDQTKKHTGF